MILAEQNKQINEPYFIKQTAPLLLPNEKRVIYINSLEICFSFSHYGSDISFGRIFLCRK